MKTRYKIKGTNRIGDKVRLTLAPEDVIQEKTNILSSIMGGNPQGMIEKMQQDALIMGQPDVVTISFEEWEKNQYKIDDIVWIDIKAET